jgi:hypothetical protein
MQNAAATHEANEMSGSDDDILSFDVSDTVLEKAAASAPGGAGGAMSFPNAPTVSILIVCCSFND